MELRRLLLQFLWPQCCELCGAPGWSLCPRCLEGLPKLEGPFCLACGGPIPCPSHGSRYHGVAAHPHEGAPRELLLAAKYGFNGDLSYCLGKAMASLIPEGSWTLTVIPPRPSQSIRPRGHDPLWWIAKGLSRAAGVAFCRLLEWDQMGPSQKEQSSLEKRRAMSRRSFRTPRGVVVPEEVLLLDDVTTSGTTLLRGADALYLAGAQRVVALCCNRAL